MYFLRENFENIAKKKKILRSIKVYTHQYCQLCMLITLMLVFIIVHQTDIKLISKTFKRLDNRNCLTDYFILHMKYFLR